MASTSVDNSASTSHVYSNAKHSDDHIRREIPATGIKDHKSSVHDQMVQHLASSIVSSCFWCMQSKLTLKFGSEALILQEEIIFWIKLCLHSEFTWAERELQWRFLFTILCARKAVLITILDVDGVLYILLISSCRTQNQLLWLEMELKQVKLLQLQWGVRMVNPNRSSNFLFRVLFATDHGRC